ncbi:uL13 family ribosomal protein, partial [Verrucomicrobiales bacterium]|nr:uL13 family ribosomal protein [Verrucomicrobiales bacterium]
MSFDENLPVPIKSREWYVIDASDQILGHVAEKAACLLRGKGKPIFTPHVDTGD